ncbi:hypothetical protein [Nonomuraea sp. NPDC049141]|uniref:hypothetical protein n=1 Tax=Nonomuraea sp. NPDC049141 TaxID=3155500 RepID=UPI0033EA21E4
MTMTGDINPKARLRVTLTEVVSARIEPTARGRWLYATLASGMTIGPIPLDARDVTAEHIPPAHWEPRVGDLWEGGGRRWFVLARFDDDGDVDGVRFLSEGSQAPYQVYDGVSYHDDELEAMLTHCPDLKLISRKGQTRGEDPWSDEPPF